MPKGPAKPWWLLPSGRLRAIWWLPIGALYIWVDYVTGAYTSFPVGYSVPVILAAWYSGALPAVALAVAIPVAQFAFVEMHPEQASTLMTMLLTVRGVVIAFIALWFARFAEHERQLRREIQVLTGLLPICSFCKNIKNEEGEWELLERFITRRSDAQFTHGLCPPCQDAHYSNVIERR